MTTEIRPADAAEMTRFKKVARASLILPPETGASGALDSIRPEMTMCAFENGELATTYAWWPLKMRLNGTSCPVAGITFVGTFPVSRRRGYLRKITTKHFRMLRERGEQPVAALHASRATIYHRYGYAVVSGENSYSFVSSHLRFIKTPGSSSGRGGLRETGEDETDILKELYRSFCKDRTGYIHRGAATWNAGVLSPPSGNGILFRIVYEEDGIPLGYVIYTVAPRRVANGRPWQHVSIRDFVWLTPDACRNLWEIFSTMDLACEIDWKRVPIDDPLTHLVQEPRELNIGSKDGLMARIVDAAEALPHRYYNGEGEVSFELIDELCPWNSGKWRMETSGAESRVEKTGAEPEMIVPIDTLAMLLFGRISPSEAARMGRLEAVDPRALPRWDRLFSTSYQPFCADFF